jgi:NCS1 family nucleobase:cation symporter-1
LGQLIGGAVMALHAAQGPQLGLPQMISCRVQFGVYGAIIPIVAVCLMYIGFSASGCVLAGQAVGQLLDVNDGLGIAIFSCLIVIVTLFGYRFIHILGRIASVIGISAKVAGLLYFSIAFGKVTVTSLNAYGSFMSMATMVSGFRRGLRISVQHRFLYIVAMVGASALLALSGRHSFGRASLSRAPSQMILPT